MVDELDGQKDPYGIKSSGLFKNTDSYSTLQLTFSYSFDYFLTDFSVFFSEDFKNFFLIKSSI